MEMVLLTSDLNQYFNLNAGLVNDLLAVAAIALILFVTIGVGYLSWVDWLDRRRRNK